MTCLQKNQAAWEMKIFQPVKILCAAKHLQVYCERPHSEINESKKVLV